VNCLLYLLLCMFSSTELLWIWFCVARLHGERVKEGTCEEVCVLMFMCMKDDTAKGLPLFGVS